VLVVAVESATEAAGVALCDESGVLAQSTFARGRRHAESIAPGVRFLCERCGVELGELDGICVDLGPGLFTGLRVGIATAKAMAFALDVPVATATSLEILANALAATGVEEGTSLVPVVDARRGEVFAARFRARAEATAGTSAAWVEPAREEDDHLWSPQDLADALRTPRPGTDEPFVLVGNGAVRYRGLLAGDRGTVSEMFAAPPVDVLARLGIRRLEAGAGLEASQVLPVYLREADVRINWEQRIPPRPAGAVST
jgi:tRNA threonylcarbamoyladenosine biosynthesis protein TsaB